MMIDVFASEVQRSVVIFRNDFYIVCLLLLTMTFSCSFYVLLSSPDCSGILFLNWLCKKKRWRKRYSPSASLRI